LVSIEADIFPLKAPDKMELINGSIGEISRFHQTFGYYAHGITPESCPLPLGWEKRLNPIKNENTNGITGLCLNVEDLACTKLAAGRPKDLDFVTEMVATGIVTISGLAKLALELPGMEFRVAAQRSLQVIDHRLKFLDISKSKEPDSPLDGSPRQIDRDDLSL
jgi:hypothetical protein